jgi:folate-dependent phosphoribosylglycinamide formyltransferase PurN
MFVEKLRVVVFTQGGLGIPISRLVAKLPNVTLAGIFCEQEIPRRRPLSERLRRNLTYHGYVGTLLRIAQAGVRRINPEGNHVLPDDVGELRSIARECSAVFTITADLHDPTVLESIRATKPDVGLVVGTTIVKPSLYDLPRLGSLNLHQGKVPEYRGSAPAFWALFNNETEYGVTVHRVVKRVDAGDVVLSATVPFNYDFVRYRLDFKRFLKDFEESLGPISVDLMIEAVRRIADGSAKFTPQDESKAFQTRRPTYSQEKEMRKVINRRYRAERRDS